MTSHDVEGEFGAVKDDLAKLRSDIASLSNALKELTSETVHDRLGSLRGGIDRLTDDAKLQSREMLDDVSAGGALHAGVRADVLERGTCSF